MTTLEDLLANVAENTLDPLPRLVLGDWLEERGDSRADQVRAISAPRQWPDLQYPRESAGYEAVRYLYKLRKGVYPSVREGKIWESMCQAISGPRRGTMLFNDRDAVQAWDWAVKDIMQGLFDESPCSLWEHPAPVTKAPWRQQSTTFKMSYNGIDLGDVAVRDWSAAH